MHKEEVKSSKNVTADPLRPRKSESIKKSRESASLHKVVGAREAGADYLSHTC